MKLHQSPFADRVGLLAQAFLQGAYVENKKIYRGTLLQDVSSLFPVSSRSTRRLET